MSTPVSTTPIRIIIIDDDEGTRQGLGFMLSFTAGVEVVGTYGDGADLEPALRLHQPDLALVDIRMPGLDGPAAVARGTALGMHTRFLLMTAFDDPADVMNSIRSGSAGLLLKSENSAEIIRAVTTVARGDGYYSARSAEYLTRQLHATASVSGGDSAEVAQARALVLRLTPGELEKAVLVAEGLTNQAIAERLQLSAHTVKSALSAIYTKLGTENRSALSRLITLAGP